jgi:DNA-directed RNA polymerase subunit M/transcription elongation factor TFIIS
MLCPKCHRLMHRKTDDGSIYYYECAACGTTIGKPVEKTESNKTADE